MPESGHGSANVLLAGSEGQNAERRLPRRGKQASLTENKHKATYILNNFFIDKPPTKSVVIHGIWQAVIRGQK